jgi:hypothetical protein
MFCRQCGHQNDDNAYKCVSCGSVLRSDPSAAALLEAVPNYLVFAILATLFCCLPLGIPAIVYASQVNSLVAAGNMQAARDASKKAKMWCWISFGLGLGFIVLYFGFVALMATVGATAGHH